jgi:uncharacterized hydrophobic protein (TIGR00271 family)
MLKELRKVLGEIIHLRDTTDVLGTIESVRRSITIRGYNVWILACGAMLASIGLDTNSAAVIIGAMLISPLMSPILGIGLSVAINDREHLMLALENFFIAVVSSLGVSTLYFLVTPLGTATEEIMARTYPTLLDVLIAIFGGIAGIVAGSRKDKTNAIPGVAIATALMPPLCTAGYGIAALRWEIFGGAFYLFFINSVFIALSTYVICRFLRFPYVEYVDEGSRRRAVTWISVLAITVSLPSGYFLFNVINRGRVERNVRSFIEEVVNNEEHEVLKHNWKGNDSTQTLTLVMAGPPMTDSMMASARRRLPDYNLTGYDLTFLQGAQLREDELRNRFTVDVLSALQPSLASRDARLDSLSRQVAAMRRKDTLSWLSLRQEMKVLFPDVERYTLAREAISHSSQESETAPDTLAVLLIDWRNGLSRSLRRQQEARLESWLQERLKVDTLLLVGR